MQNVQTCEVINVSSLPGCYGVKPDSVSESWICTRCAEGAWTVVGSSLRTLRREVDNQAASRSNTSPQKQVQAMQLLKGTTEVVSQS